MKKNVIISLLLFIIPFVGLSQKEYKLKNQSSKERPGWIYESRTDALMIQTKKAASIEDAQNEVMSDLLHQIASSVAVTVSGEIIKDIDWTTIDLKGKTREEYIESIKQNTTVKIAKIPEMQGIALLKAEKYWEEYINKKTKESFYDLYILYPFSLFELQELIDAYNAQQKAYSDKIDSYRNSLPEKNNIDNILNDITEMKTLLKEFEEYDSKYRELKNVISLYEKTITNLYIEVVENENSKLVIQLKHDEKVMKTKSLPQLRSECARDFTRKHNGNQIDITFNSFDCYEQDDNYVEIRFNFGKKRILKKVNIKL